ncbi:unnamed protein product [Victoria cruziana]
MASICPFARAVSATEVCPRKIDESQSKHKKGSPEKNESASSVMPTAKCPFGYDSQSFKLGPLSCIICQALLFETSKCVPCSHKFCKHCVSRFKDCPLCGADIEKIEPDSELQEMVDRFIEGHARIKRSHPSDTKMEGEQPKNVIYEDVSLERGAFLVQQAMRAFRAQNIESSKSRLSLCVEDIREQIQRVGNTSELCTQLGAVLGMLGDCSRALGDSRSAVSYFEESVEFLSKLQVEDLEVTHTLSVSLNKIGDLKYYDGDVLAAKKYYAQALDVRRNAVKNQSKMPSQMLDVAVSLAKVADADRNLGYESLAIERFHEAIECLEHLTISAGEIGLEKRRLSVLQFLHDQLGENLNSEPAAASE